jgi:hypothetical protein
MCLTSGTNALSKLLLAAEANIMQLIWCVRRLVPLHKDVHTEMSNARDPSPLVDPELCFGDLLAGKEAASLLGLTPATIGTA